MRTEKQAATKPCPKCGSWGITVHYEDGSNIPQSIICDGCGEDSR